MLLWDRDSGDQDEKCLSRGVGALMFQERPWQPSGYCVHRERKRGPAARSSQPGCSTQPWLLHENTPGDKINALQ